MPIDPNALTSLESVKGYLKIDESQTNENSLLTDLINACSFTIENYCGRQFKKRVFSEQEYDGNGRNYLLLEQFPIVSIETVYIDGELLDPGQYKAKKGNGILIRKNSVWPKGDANIAVSYTAGYSEIPYDLELACKHLVMFYYKSDVASFSTTFQEGFVFRPEALPSQVKALVAPYKKVC